MKSIRPSFKPRQQELERGMERAAPAPGSGGGKAARRRPVSPGEPIPDGQPAYVPRSPYRTRHG